MFVRYCPECRDVRVDLQYVAKLNSPPKPIYCENDGHRMERVELQVSGSGELLIIPIRSRDQ